MPAATQEAPAAQQQMALPSDVVSQQPTAEPQPEPQLGLRGGEEAGCEMCCGLCACDEMCC
ncbi:hypothetical protein B0T11DRAFT_323323 [Plectosphaerella cucumerina]|uniref:Uncharacterized protein n=1 Tax=Plectosphaerella cucumerina TaxID=40658 RepID=A0A8K0X9S6_9PEZI|nr:hypothetical protein B0T11DRAFT_323323 [Plectosphaerella cucumerina]